MHQQVLYKIIGLVIASSLSIPCEDYMTRSTFHKSNNCSEFFFTCSDKSFGKMNQFENDFHPNEGDNEPLQPDVMLVAQVRSNLKYSQTRL